MIRPAASRLRTENLWLLAYPLRMLGADLRRNVTLKDEAAFKSSLATILGWDLDRVIVGHGEVIESDGKTKWWAALDAAEVSIA